MADSKNNIARYITGLMDEEEELAFEAEMAANEDLRLQVRLEQARLANIQRRVKTALDSEEEEKTGETKAVFPLDAVRKSSWQWWTLAAAIAGLAIVSIWLFRPDINTRQIDVVQQPPKEDTSATISTHRKPEKTRTTTPSSPPSLPDYKKIAHNTYNLERPKSTVSTSGEQNIPATANADTATLAFQAYLNGDSVMVFTYYERYPNERRAVEWKARYLFEHSRYGEAAVLFAQLKSFPKYEDKGAWYELLCYLAQYQTKKKDFDRLKNEVRKTKYKEDLYNLLKQIR